jgi:ABC-type branched-subunit amino acid transport system ATPase component
MEGWYELFEGRRFKQIFWGLKAVHHVDFEIEQGEILGLIGPNDQGKGSRGRYASFIANFPRW